MISASHIYTLSAIILMFSWLSIEGSEDHKINLKIGFDLIPKSDGNPSIRIREFEDFNLRKMGRKEEMSVRGEDTSSEIEEIKNEEKDDKDSGAVAVESSESDERALRSTKGIHPNEFEPETHSLNNRGKHSDSETEER